jgi:hypothetical protein
MSLELSAGKLCFPPQQIPLRIHLLLYQVNIRICQMFKPALKKALANKIEATTVPCPPRP